jgi:hypothetical protein
MCKVSQLFIMALLAGGLVTQRSEAADAASAPQPAVPPEIQSLPAANQQGVILTEEQGESIKENLRPQVGEEIDEAPGFFGDL